MAALGDSRPPAIGRGGLTSYTGPWRFDGTTLLIASTVCSDPARMGTDQIRGVRTEGERLVLTPPPRLVDGANQQPELVWNAWPEGLWPEAGYCWAIRSSRSGISIGVTTTGAVPCSFMPRSWAMRGLTSMTRLRT